MSECFAMRESMPMLLTESLDSAGREAAHMHIESCGACSDEWATMKETWQLLDELPVVEVPSRVKARFLDEVAGRSSQVAGVTWRGPRSSTSRSVICDLRPASCDPGGRWSC